MGATAGVELGDHLSVNRVNDMWSNDGRSNDLAGRMMTGSIHPHGMMRPEQSSCSGSDSPCIHYQNVARRIVR